MMDERLPGLRFVQRDWRRQGAAAPVALLAVELFLLK